VSGVLYILPVRPWRLSQAGLAIRAAVPSSSQGSAFHSLSLSPFICCAPPGQGSFTPRAQPYPSTERLIHRVKYELYHVHSAIPQL